MIKKIISYLKSSSQNPLIRNVLLVGFITVIVKLVAFYKETLIAGSFGLSEILDTFLIALLVPSFIQSVFINALKNIFIPNYINELKNKGNVAAFQSVVFIITFSIALFAVLIAFLSTDVFLDLVYPGHTESYYALVKKQLYIVLPCLFFWGFSSLLSGLLEVYSRFFYSTISSIFSAITIILFLIFLKEELQEMVLAISLLTGCFLEFLYLLFISIKTKVLKISRPKLNSNVIVMLKQLPPKISSGLLSALNNYVDHFFAAQLAIGSITAISYGAKIPAIIITILIIAMGNVLLPHFSRKINEDLKKAYKELFRILLLVFVGAALVISVLAFFSKEIISFLFERNAFDADDTLVVANIQQILLLYVPFYLCTLILVKFLTSINKNKFMAWASLFNLILNIALNSYLVKRYGIYGLAVSTATVYTISSFIYFSFTRLQYRKLIKKANFNEN